MTPAESTLATLAPIEYHTAGASRTVSPSAPTSAVISVAVAPGSSATQGGTTRSPEGSGGDGADSEPARQAVAARHNVAQGTRWDGVRRVRPVRAGMAVTYISRSPAVAPPSWWPREVPE